MADDGSVVVDDDAADDVDDVTNVEEKISDFWGGRRAAWGCHVQSLALYRASLGALLFLELALRYRFVKPFYSDEGTLPLRLLRPKVDDLYLAVCVHCYSGSCAYQYFLLTVQAFFAFCLAIGYRTKFACAASWFLYLSLTLRNTWLNFILDRYFHYLLFYGMFLPLDTVWSVDSYLLRRSKPKRSSGKYDDGDGIVLSVATIAIKLQILWLYLDAGYGKYSDPLGGWTYDARPLPALDAYARHTVVARYMYAILRPEGLRLLTPVVVYVELFGMPIAWIGSYLGKRWMTFAAVGIVMGLHAGIALTVRNTTLLSSVACAACTVYLPPLFPSRRKRRERPRRDPDDVSPPSSTVQRSRIRSLAPALIIIPFVCGSIWFETMSAACDQSVRHVWSTLLHNRWNVFVGAEEYVTWEIAPGRLADSSIVDVWSRTPSVDWSMPGAGTPCTSTSRPGRWRSFPYLAELEGDDADALWGYLCRQWDEEHDVENNPGRKLLRYNFFMLQADVLPDMGFSATRKRLVRSHVCVDETRNPDWENDEGTKRGDDEGWDAITKGGDAEL